jgi:hypothetical protein
VSDVPAVVGLLMAGFSSPPALHSQKRGFKMIIRRIIVGSGEPIPIARRAAALLLAGALAAGLSMGKAGAAQAAGGIITPPSYGEYHELFDPYLTNQTYKCLDVPSASNSAGATLQMFRCHGWDPDGRNQRWTFFRLGGLPTGESIVDILNGNSGLCLAAAAPGQWLTQDHCSGPAATWVPVPNPYDPGGFELQNYLFRAYCATVNDFTGDHSRLTLRLCNGNTTDTYLQDWELG